MFEQLFGPSVVWELLIGDNNVVVGNSKSKEARVTATAAGAFATNGKER